jgi:dinuclear metal center YbgI/SA1388 family protein
MAKLSKKTTVGALVKAMETIAPPWAAEEWDNVGLQTGDPRWTVSRILLTIDLTWPVLEEAVRGGFDAIVAYHPPIFRAVKRLVCDRTDSAGLAVEALSRKIAIYSPHTALDAAPGGTNDTVAKICGLEEVQPIKPTSQGGPRCKLVTFVPPADVDRLAEALFDAGAGRIGDYEKCSFRLGGEGTFFGAEATAPVVGRKGRLEHVQEIRLEAVLPRSRLADVTAALRRAHPYEEPAFDVYPLEPVRDRRIGQGRIGRFAKATTLTGLARLLARKIGARHISAVGLGNRPLRRGIVWVGAAGSEPLDAVGGRCKPGDVVVTGEIRHHDALRYARHDVAALAIGHWISERPVLKPLAKRLATLLPGVEVAVSRADRDPFCPS